MKLNRWRTHVLLLALLFCELSTAVVRGGGYTGGLSFWRPQTLRQPKTYSSGGSATSPRATSAADLNADSKIDIVTINNSSHNVSVHLGNGDGTFAAAVVYTLGANICPVDGKLGDFNNDSKLDIVSTAYCGGLNYVVVLYGNGDGTFGTPHTFSIAPSSQASGIAVGDFNNDGKPDVATGSDIADNIAILLGNGAGFGSATTFSAGVDPDTPVIADLNADGKQDLVVTNESGASVSVLIGDGTGSFAAPVGYSVGTSPQRISVGDFNGDSKQDIAVVNSGSDNVSIRLGNGDGTLGSVSHVTVGDGPRGLAIADIDGDGKLDLLSASDGNVSLMIFRGKGDGTFSFHGTVTTGSGPRDIIVVDLNGDTKPDVALSNKNDNTISIFLRL